MGEGVQIKTWADKTDGVYFPRYFEFYDVHNELLGAASSLWLLFNVEHRRVVRPSNLPNPYDTPKGLIPPLPFPEKIKAEQQPLEFFEDRKVRYSDCDVNSHMNNTRYAEYICDLQKPEYYKENSFSELTINYNVEAMPEDILSLSTYLSGKVFYVSGELKNSGKNIFTAKCVL